MTNKSGGKPALIADLGDLHINSTTGLLDTAVKLDDGGYYHPSKKQAWVYQRFREYCFTVAAAKKKLQAELWILLKGELADNLKKRTTQLITRNEVDIINMAADCLTPLVDLGDHVVVLRGTEAHVGGSGWMDEAIARALADRVLGDRLIRDQSVGTYSHFIWRGTIGGINIHAGHHPGASSRVPHNRGNEANKTAARVFYEYSKANARRYRAGKDIIGWPDLALFGHNHWPADSKDSHPVRVLISPSWQLNTAFGHRLGGDQMPVGGNIIQCKGAGRFDVYECHYYEPLAAFGAPGAEEL